MGNQPQTTLEALARSRSHNAMDTLLAVLREERDQLFAAHVEEGFDTIGVIKFLHKQARSTESAMKQLGFHVPADRGILKIRQVLGSALDA